MRYRYFFRRFLTYLSLLDSERGEEFESETMMSDAPRLKIPEREIKTISIRFVVVGS